MGITYIRKSNLTFQLRANTFLNAFSPSPLLLFRLWWSLWVILYSHCIVLPTCLGQSQKLMQSKSSSVKIEGVHKIENLDHDQLYHVSCWFPRKCINKVLWFPINMTKRNFGSKFKIFSQIVHFGGMVASLRYM